jgi:hypothetical protein
MKSQIPFHCLIIIVAVLANSLNATAANPDSDSDGFVSLFDGESLKGWDGNPDFWKVQDGAITGVTTKDNPTKGNTFIIYVGDNKDNTPVEFGDFELKIDFRIVAHNSGIQYRSFKLPGNQDGWRIGGYQADFDAAKGWVGTNYGERFRGVLAKRGERVTIGVTEQKGKKPKTARTVESLGDSKELASKVNDAPEWNEYHIIANGFHFVQRINGVTMSELNDNDEKNRRAAGLIAIQLHGGPPMTVQARNIRIKQLGSK